MTFRSDGKPESHHRYESESHPQIPTHTPRFFPGEVARTGLARHSGPLGPELKSRLTATTITFCELCGLVMGV